MTFATKITAFFCMFWAGLASAQNFDGTYQATGSDPATACQFGVSETTIEIGEGAVFFWETTCDLTNASPAPGMKGVFFDGVCNGEGDQWTERMFLYSTYDGVAILSDGVARTYTVCPQ